MSLTVTIGSIFMASLILMIRLKKITKPISGKKIILPPLFMSTGLLMFLFESTRLVPLHGIIALFVGFCFSLLLIKTSTFEIKNDQIYLKRSKSFIFILVVLLAARIVVKFLLGDSINIEALGSMFFLLAYGMIIPWRLSMYLSFRKIEKQLRSTVDKLLPAET